MLQRYAFSLKLQRKTARIFIGERKNGAFHAERPPFPFSTKPIRAARCKGTKALQSGQKVMHRFHNILQGVQRKVCNGCRNV